LISESSAISIAILYIISVYCEYYARYFTVILPFLAFYFCFAYFTISGILHDLYMFLFFEGDELIYFFLAMLEDMVLSGGHLLL
jgi:hypothetical protein